MGRSGIISKSGGGSEATVGKSFPPPLKEETNEELRLERFLEEGNLKVPRVGGSCPCKRIRVISCKEWFFGSSEGKNQKDAFVQQAKRDRQR